MTPTIKSQGSIPKNLPKSFKIYNVLLRGEIKGLGNGVRSLVVWELEDKIIWLDWMRGKYGTTGKIRFKRLYPERVKNPAIKYIRDKLANRLYNRQVGRLEIEKLLKAIK